jgi:two-component system, NtrC family, response regulator HydG
LRAARGVHTLAGAMNPAEPDPTLRFTPSEAAEHAAPGRILIVDDDRTMCEAIELTLGRGAHDIMWRTSGHHALELVAERDFDVVLTDLSMPAMSGVELCERVLAARPDVPVVVVTAHTTIEAAISAIRAGAYDFIVKPVDGKLLALAVARAVRHRRLRNEAKRLRRMVASAQRPGQMVGASPAMKVVLDLIGRVANSDTTVLVTGESGTGKELIARALHDQSARRDGPFVAINCSAVPAALLESELFGHARGAFTDATATRTGLFMQANGGTLFLDEIGELPMEMQPKILRALQERTVRPVGGNAETPFDARIVTATNRDIEAEVAAKRFRADLFYRINVVHIHAPPLRARPGDVLLLAQRFVERFAAKSGKAVRGITPQAGEKLAAYDWPGNVRELENCMERAMALLRFDAVTVDDLPEKIRQYATQPLGIWADELTDILTLDELGRRYTLRILAFCNGNKARAASLLGLDRRTLYRQLERYERQNEQ